MASLSGSDRISIRRRILDGNHEVQEQDPECNLTLGFFKRLPEVLVDEILAMLPFSSLVRFCSVCKRWRDIILFSETFHRSTSQLNRLFSFSKRKNLNVFSSGRSTWEAVSLQFLPTQVALLDVVASSGGLLCFDTKVQGELIVCNPLTKRYKTLQMPSHMLALESVIQCAWLAGIVVDSHTGHFKLILASFYYSRGESTIVYNSLADTWKKVAPIPEGPLGKCFDLKRKLQATECGGSLFFYVTFGTSFDRLLKYDVEHEAWRWIRTPGYSSGLARNIIEHSGKILLVTSVFDHWWKTTSTVFYALELQEEGPNLWLCTSWLPLARARAIMPDMRGIQCVGQGDVLFFIRRNFRSFLAVPWLRSTPFRGKPESHWPKNTSVREWLGNGNTNSDVVSNWAFEGDEEFRVDVGIFTPSTHKV